MFSEYTTSITLTEGASPSDSLFIHAPGKPFITLFIRKDAGSTASKAFTLKFETANKSGNILEEPVDLIPIEAVFVAGAAVSVDADLVYTFNTDTFDYVIIKFNVPTLQMLKVSMTSVALGEDETILLELQCKLAAIDVANFSTLVDDEGNPIGIDGHPLAVVIDETDIDMGNVALIDSGGDPVGEGTNPLATTLQTAAGTAIGTVADPLPVGLTTAAGAAIGEAGAAPLFVEPVDSSGVEIFSDANPASVQIRTADGTAAGTTTNPIQVEALITDGAGNPVQQSVSVDDATVTRWELSSVAVTANTTYVGTGRDCSNLPWLDSSLICPIASNPGGAKLQHSSNNSTWYDLPYTIGTAVAATALQLANRGGHGRAYVRISFDPLTGGGATTLISDLSASPC